MMKEELGNGSGVAWQEFAVGSSIQTVMGLANGFLGRKSLLTRGSGPAEAEQTRDGGDFESTIAVQEEMAEHASGVIVAALRLAKAEGGLQQGQLLRSEACLGELRVGQPGKKGILCVRHRSPSRATRSGYTTP